VKTIIIACLLLVGVLLPGCGCPGGIGIPPEPTQELIDAAKLNLSKDDALGLQILFGYFHEILTDGVHNGDT